MKVQLMNSPKKTSLQIDPFAKMDDDQFTPVISVVCYRLEKNNRLIEPSINTSDVPSMMTGAMAKAYSAAMVMAANIVDSIFNEHGLMLAFDQIKARQQQDGFSLTHHNASTSLH